jgi:hypothetical protein
LLLQSKGVTNSKSGLDVQDIEFDVLLILNNTFREKKRFWSTNRSYPRPNLVNGHKRESVDGGGVLEGPTVVGIDRMWPRLTGLP